MSFARHEIEEFPAFDTSQDYVLGRRLQSPIWQKILPPGSRPKIFERAAAGLEYCTRSVPLGYQKSMAELTDMCGSYSVRVESAGIAVRSAAQRLSRQCHVIRSRPCLPTLPHVGRLLSVPSHCFGVFLSLLPASSRCLLSGIAEIPIAARYPPKLQSHPRHSSTLTIHVSRHFWTSFPTDALLYVLGFPRILFPNLACIIPISHPHTTRKLSSPSLTLFHPA
jgi:hypothetical protein